jgi:hypothetical protein
MDASDAEQGLLWERYRSHLASFASSLPVSFRLLVEAGGSISLHDGRILNVFQERESNETLVVDVHVGEVPLPSPILISVLHVRIVYRGAELISPELSKLRALIRDPKTAILYTEVDPDRDGRFEHHMSLWRGKRKETAEVAVRFADADVIPVRFQGAAATVIDGR